MVNCFENIVNTDTPIHYLPQAAPFAPNKSQAESALAGNVTPPLSVGGFCVLSAYIKRTPQSREFC